MFLWMDFQGRIQGVNAMLTAVAAIAADWVRRQAILALADAQIDLLYIADDALQAWRALNDQRPDLLLADMELPYMEGASLVMRALKSFALPVRPKAMLLRYPEFPIAMENDLRALGCAFVCKPIDLHAFHAELDALCAAPPQFHPETRRRIDSILDELGVPKHAGRNCLRDAALICASDERAQHRFSRILYPQIGAQYAMDASQVERAIGHAINLAWQSDKFDNQNRIFSDAVDAGRGQPTCREMILRLADILRSEG